MHVVTSKKDLLRAAKRMSLIAEKKSTMPILACVYLRATGKELTLVATDLFQALTMTIDAEVDSSGSVAVSAKDLVDRASVLPDGPVELSIKDAALTIKGKGSARRFTMRGMPGDDYPPIPKPDPGAPSFKLEVAALSRLIGLTVQCVSTDETRAHLNSLQLEWEGDTLRAVSTDGHRLAKADMRVSSSASTSFLLPLKAVKEVQRLCEEVQSIRAADGVGQTLTVIQGGATAYFVAAGVTFSVKLVDAQFPPYRQVIPADSRTRLRAPRAALADAVKAVAVSSDEKSGGVKFSLSRGVMRLSSESHQAGDGVDEVAVEYDGPSMSFGLAARYVGEALGVLWSDEVVLGTNGELEPVVVRPIVDSGVDAVIVIMPLRI